MSRHPWRQTQRPLRANCLFCPGCGIPTSVERAQEGVHTLLRHSNILHDVAACTNRSAAEPEIQDLIDGSAGLYWRGRMKLRKHLTDP